MHSRLLSCQLIRTTSFLHSLNILMLKTARLSIIMGTVRDLKTSKPWLLYSHYSPGHLVYFTVVGKSSGQHSALSQEVE